MAGPSSEVDPEIAGYAERRRQLAAPSQRRTTALRIGSAILATVVVLIASTALLGWVTGHHQWAQWSDGSVTMKVITGFLLVIQGSALILLATNSENSRRERLVLACAAVVVVMAVLVICSYVTPSGIRLIDSFFGLQPTEPFAPNRGRAAPLTAIALLFLAPGSFLQARGHSLLAQSLALGGLLVGTTALIGFGFGVTDSYAGGVFAVMALPTAVSLFCASLSLLLAAPQQGLMESLTNDTVGGLMARRMMPVIVAIAVGISLIATLDLWGNSLDPRVRPAVVTTLLLVAGIGGTWIFAAQMRWLDVSRGAAEDTVTSTRQLVAERDAMLAERDELARNLARANEDLTSFAAVAAHDLRAPLVAIRGYAELLADHPSLINDARGQEWISRIIGGSDRGAQLIVDTLDCARLSTRVIDAIPVDLRDLVGDLVHNGEHAASVDLAPLPTVLGEAPLLRQLFNNLIENAFKYAPRDRDIRVRVDAVGAHSEAGRQMVTVRVSDNGDGIAPQDRERLLGMFVRGPHRDVTGTGLGLAICARVAERHGGKLWIEADPSGGARVCATLPLAGH